MYHLPLGPHICVSEWGQHWFSCELLSIEPSGANFSEILIKNTKLFIHKNASEHIVCEMAAILSRGDELSKGGTNGDYSSRFYKIINDIINSSPRMLTHLPLDKMTAISFANDILRYIFANEKFCILIKISLKFVPESPINNNPALV